MRALWQEVPTRLVARHFIWIQWDSWVLDADRWTNEFLGYDYIGAPWPLLPGSLWDRMGYVKGRNVGNGGFSLRSTALMRHCQNLTLWLPEDDAICRKHRAALEAKGFRWAPEELAARFSFEYIPAEGTFGFHGKHNFPRVLDEYGLKERASAGL